MLFLFDSYKKISLFAYGIPEKGEEALLFLQSAFSASFKADSLQTVMKQFIFLFAFSILFKKNLLILYEKRICYPGLFLFQIN